MKFKPCQNNATCNDSSGEGNYNCTCLAGYSGRNCETGTKTSKFWGPFTISDSESECEIFIVCLTSLDVNSYIETSRTTIVSDVVFIMAIALSVNRPLHRQCTVKPFTAINNSKFDCKGKWSFRRGHDKHQI